MSGHSKWATTHRQKEANDAKKGVAFTKLAMAITMAVKQGGGGDAEKNFRLRLAVEKARQFNMPKENISRAIEKGTGAGGGAILTEALFEGFAPGGVAVLVEALTDNTMRTGQQVRMAFEKHGGHMGSSGAVSYLFKHIGEVRIRNHELGDEDELKMIDLGVDDIEMDPDGWTVYCEKERTFEVKEAVNKSGFEVESTELVMKPNVLVEVTDPEAAKRIESLLEQLESIEDVQKVWTNYA